MSVKSPVGNTSLRRQYSFRHSLLNKCSFFRFYKFPDKSAEGKKVNGWTKELSKMKSTEKSTRRKKSTVLFCYYNEIHIVRYSQERAVFSTQVWRLKGTVPSIKSTQIRTSWQEHIQDTDPMTSESQSQRGKGQACSSVTMCSQEQPEPHEKSFNSFHGSTLNDITTSHQAPTLKDCTLPSTITTLETKLPSNMLTQW